MKPNSNTDAEDDFWDLGDEDELSLIPRSKGDSVKGLLNKSQLEGENLRKEEVGVLEEDDFSKKISKKKPKEELELEDDDDALGSIDDDDDDDVAADQEEKEEAISEPEPEEQEVVREKIEDDTQADVQASEGIKGCLKSKLVSLSLVEKVSLLSVLVIFIGATYWGIVTYYAQAPEGTFVSFTEDFPVEGQHAAIAEIETYWRKPIRTGEDADHGVQLRARLIPCARLKLSGSGTATLAVSFRDSDLDLIGDPISLVVENGIFKKSGSAEIVITSTAGFENLSDINAYANLDIDPWSVLIVEGAPGTNPSYTEADKKLAEVRISSITRD